MSKVLYIKATPKLKDDSWTLKMSEAFIENYKKNNPNDLVTELNLYDENFGYLTMEELQEMPLDAESNVKKYANQFIEYDKYVIAAPFWNLSVPAILKSYIDRLMIVGKTFKYTETGSQSLITGKKAMFFMAMGGIYSIPPMNKFENGIKYLDLTFGDFLQMITDSVTFEGTAVYEMKELEKKFQNTLIEITEKAKSF